MMPNLRDVNWLTPVNLGHSFNRGRLCWLLSLPNIQGQIWRDLMAHYDGTLTNTSGTVTSGFVPGTSRLGGFGSLAFDGVDDTVVVPASMIGALAGSRTATMAAWFYPTGNFTAFQALFDASSDGTSVNRMLSIFLGSAINHLFVCMAGDAGQDITLSESWVLNSWQRVVVSWDGNTYRVYRNGRQVGTAANGAQPGFSACPWIIGGNPSTGGAAYPGFQDDLSVWSRVLSAAEVKADYELPRLGYQGVLNYSLAMMRRFWALGGTVNILTLSATSTGNASFVRQNGWLRALTSSATASALRQTGKNLPGTSSLSPSLARQAGKPVSGTSSGSSTLVRQTGALRIATSSGVASLARSAARSLILTSSAAVTLLRSLSRTLATLTITGTAALARQTAKTIFATSAGAASLLRQAGKALFASSVLSAAVQAVKTLTAFALTLTTDAIAGSASLMRQSARSLRPNLTGTASLHRQAIRTFATLTTLSLALLRQSGKALAGTSRGAAVLVRQGLKILSGVCTVVAQTTAGRSFFPALSAVSVGLVSLVRKPGKVLFPQLDATAHLTRGTAKTLLVVALSLVSLTRILTATLSAGTASAAALITRFIARAFLYLTHAHSFSDLGRRQARTKDTRRGSRGDSTRAGAAGDSVQESGAGEDRNGGGGEA